MASPLLGLDRGLGRGRPLSTPGTALKKTGDRAHLAGVWRDLPGRLSGSHALPQFCRVGKSGRKGAKQGNGSRSPSPRAGRAEDGAGTSTEMGPKRLLGPLLGQAVGVLPSPTAGGPGRALCIKWRGHDGDPDPRPPGPPSAPLRPSAGATGPQAAGDGQSCPSSVSPPRARSSMTGRSGERGKSPALVALSEALSSPPPGEGDNLYHDTISTPTQ